MTYVKFKLLITNTLRTVGHNKLGWAQKAKGPQSVSLLTSREKSKSAAPPTTKINPVCIDEFKAIIGDEFKGIYLDDLWLVYGINIDFYRFWKFFLLVPSEVKNSTIQISTFSQIYIIASIRV